MAADNDEREKHLRDLFNRLDKNRDGKIEYNELKEALTEMEREKSQRHGNGTSSNQVTTQKDTSNNKDARVLFEKIGKGSDSLNFRDFVDYISQTDKKIELVFYDLDADKNGIIEAKEIKQAFEKLNIILNDKDVEKLIGHIDTNKSLRIDWNEWRDFFRFAPHDHIEQMLQHWRRETFVDYGDQPLPNDYTKKEKETGLWWRNLLAGGTAGIISRTCTAPLDRVKIFMQVHGNENKLSIAGAMKNMVKEGGIKSLWRGNGINVIKIAPESALKFMAYEQIKILMGKDGQALPPWQKLISGSLAGFISQSTIYPMEVLKTRLALRKTGQYSSIFDCVKKIYKFEGLKAFYRGYFINTIGILPAAGVDLALYETLKNYYKELYPNNPQPNVLAVLLIANTSSTCAMFSSYPLFLIRTKLQSSTNPKDSVLSIVQNIYKKDGLLGFFRGSIPNLAKVAPAASIGYITYEQSSKYLGLKR